MTCTPWTDKVSSKPKPEPEPNTLANTSLDKTTVSVDVDAYVDIVKSAKLDEASPGYMTFARLQNMLKRYTSFLIKGGTIPANQQSLVEYDTQWFRGEPKQYTADGQEVKSPKALLEESSLDKEFINAANVLIDALEESLASSKDVDKSCQAVG